jgi:hypothetical protein
MGSQRAKRTHPAHDARLDHGAAALDLSPHALRICGDRLEESGDEWTGDRCFIRVPGSVKQRC